MLERGAVEVVAIRGFVIDLCFQVQVKLGFFFEF